MGERIGFRPKGDFPRIPVQTNSFLLRKEFGRFSGATRVSNARNILSANTVTKEVVRQIAKDFDTATKSHSNLDSDRVADLLMGLEDGFHRVG